MCYVSVSSAWLGRRWGTASTGSEAPWIYSAGLLLEVEMLLLLSLRLRVMVMV